MPKPAINARIMARIIVTPLLASSHAGGPRRIANPVRLKSHSTRERKPLSDCIGGLHKSNHRYADNVFHLAKADKDREYMLSLCDYQKAKS
jgi:hypothetical protein